MLTRQKANFIIWIPFFFLGCSFELLTSKKIDSEDVINPVGIPYYLAKARFLIDLKIGDKITEKVVKDKDDKVIAKEQILEYETTIKLTQKAVPDPDQVYLLNYENSIWYDDDIDIRVSKDGFIQTSITNILKSDDKKIELGGESKDESLIELPNSSVTMRYTVTTAPDSLTTEEKAFANELREDLLVLKGNQNFVFGVSNENYEVKVNSAMAQGSLKLICKTEKFSKKTTELPNTNVETNVDQEEFNNGIKFRLPYPYLVNVSLIYQSKNGQEVKLANMDTIALVPDNSPVYTLPVERYAFINTALAAEFRNGQVQNSKLKKSSPISNFFNLPKDLLNEVKGLIEAIGKAIDSKVGTLLGVGAAVGG